jgi:hypothetical protein
MAGYLPSSEADLERSRPPTSQLGVFPPTALQGGEKVLYECRPKISTAGWVVIVFFAFWVLALTAVYTSSGMYWATPVGIFAVLLIALIFASPILFVLARWRGAAYAMTDQRIVARHGSSFESAGYDQVFEVSLKGKSSTVIFRLQPPPAGTPSGLFGPSRNPTMTWTNVAGAPAVVSWAKSAVAYYRIRNRQRELRQQVTVASLMDRIVCPYCGARIDIATLAPDNPKCPSCSAPVIVAPMGL